MSGTGTTALALLRRWVVDYFNSHDAVTAREFIAPDYALHIGDIVFAGRDTSWLPAVDEQMRRFPGLGMTVHQAIWGDGWAAAYFSEHGASEGRAAVWSGVAIYMSDGTRLTGCRAQEDYATRQRQLKSGLVDPVEPPALAPWDTPARPRDAEAEAVVARWLNNSWPAAGAVCCDDEHITGEVLRFDVARTAIHTLVSSGPDVAFSARQTGTYLSGFPQVKGTGIPAFLDSNGLVRVENSMVVRGRVIRDRLGLRARLAKGGSS